MKLSDTELIAAIEAEEAVAVDGNTGTLADERAEALARYRGLGWAGDSDLQEQGRSTVVSKDILDTIEWIVPSIARIYLGGEEIGKFAAIGPEDEYAAECETEVCNWYLQEKNDSFTEIISVIKDALLLKNGYAVVNWTTREDRQTETYQGLSDEEATMLQQDEEVTVLEHTETQDPITGMTLHDVKVEMKTGDEYPEVEAIPTNEIKVSRRHRKTSLADADFVQWQRFVSIGQARAEGFDVPDDAPSYSETTSEGTLRERFAPNIGQEEDDQTPDPSRKMIRLKHTWIRIDLRGKGKQQLWRIDHVHGMKTPLRKEEANIVQVAAFSPIIYPHSHIGMSVYDLINDLGLIKTTLQRQFLDGVYQANSGQFVVDVNRVNVDDWLVTRPGGIRRVEGGVSDAWAPIPVNDASQIALQGLEYVDSVKEGRTGVTRYSAGLDANSLNKTATGVQAIQSAANQRIELIARTLASGFKDLFLIIHALASQHSTKPIQVKLKGQWQPIDPRSWKKRTDFQVSVGLGTGNPEQQMQKLMMIGQQMQMGASMGLCGPQEFYNYGKEFLKAAGFKNTDKFMKEPPKGPDGQPLPQQQPPNPEMMKAQAQIQIEQQKAQINAQVEQAKAQIQSQLAQQQMAFDKWKTEFEGQVKIAVAQIAAQTTKQVKVGDVATEFAWMNQEEQQHNDKMAQEHADRMAGLATTAVGHQAAAQGKAQDHAFNAHQSQQDKAFQDHQTRQGQAHEAYMTDAQNRFTQQENAANRKAKPKGK